MKRAERERQARKRRALFEGAMYGEALGQHPGQVRVAVVLEVSHAGLGRRVRVSEPIELLVGAWVELEGARAACEAGLRAWLAGHLSAEGFVCECGAVVPRGRKK